jgi:phosphoglycerate dehydrogenase-like enzyme
VIVTCHTSALSYPEDIAPIFLDNLQHFLAGATLNNRVDFVRGY